MIYQPYCKSREDTLAAKTNRRMGAQKQSKMMIPCPGRGEWCRLWRNECFCLSCIAIFVIYLVQGDIEGSLWMLRSDWGRLQTTRGSIWFSHMFSWYPEWSWIDCALQVEDALAKLMECEPGHECWDMGEIFVEILYYDTLWELNFNGRIAFQLLVSKESRQSFWGKGSLSLSNNAFLGGCWCRAHASQADEMPGGPDAVDALAPCLQSLVGALGVLFSWNQRFLIWCEAFSSFRPCSIKKRF